MKSQSHSAKVTQDKVIKEKLKKLPDEPGVYMFVQYENKKVQSENKNTKNGNKKIPNENKKPDKKILYVGKATSLKDRVRSYFNKDIVNTRSPLISKMLSEFDDIEFIKTSSVLEALVLEANLIKKFQPEANIKEKDDRSFNFVVITNEDFPRVLVMRGRGLEKLSELSSRKNPREERRRRTEEIFSKKFPWFLRDAAKDNFSQENVSKNFSIKKMFGPFPNGSQLKEAMKIVRKMFPFRDKCEVGRGKPCFNRQIGLCPGVCTGEISKEEYAETIKNIILFFESDKKKLIKNLERQMKNFAKIREFEKAAKIKKTIFTLNHIQDVALIKYSKISKFKLNIFDTDKFSIKRKEKNFRIESYDIAHMSGENIVGVMTVLENGEIKKSDYRKFLIKDLNKNRNNFSSQKNKMGIGDTQALSEVLSRRLVHTEWSFPDLLVVDGGVAQKNVMEKILKEKNFSIPVVAVLKDQSHRPKEILGLNNLDFIKRENLNVSNQKNSSVIKQKEDINELEKQILLANAEAHRFAIAFHRKRRSKIF